MQLLLEEFFSKIWKLNEEGSVFLKFVVRLIIVLIVIGGLYLIVKAVLSRNYTALIVIVIFLILAEIAHFIRKSREKIVVDKAATENQLKKAAKEILQPSKSKNKNLLKINRPKNKKMLKEKKKKKFKNLNLDRSILKNEKIKNKGLLKSNKPKNKNMLDLKNENI